MIKYIIMLTALSAVLGGVWAHGNSHGKQTMKAAYTKVINASLVKQSELIDSLEESKNKRTVITKEKIRTVYVKDDPTGCADTDVPIWMLDSLPTSEARSATN